MFINCDHEYIFENIISRFFRLASFVMGNFMKCSDFSISTFSGLLGFQFPADRQTVGFVADLLISYSNFFPHHF
jgi:hypothetical protein